MLEEIIKLKIEPAAFVLDQLNNIVFTNSKANQYLKNKKLKANLLQLSSTLIEGSSKKNQPQKITGIKLDRRNLSLHLDPFIKNTKTYFLFKIEDETGIKQVDKSKINFNLLTKLNKIENDLENSQNLVDDYSKEISLYSEENIAINDELKHLNTEYVLNINKLKQSNKQLNYLIYNTNVATIFLNEQLKVLKYSNTATKLFYIKQVDINRSIKDFKNRFIDQNWIQLLPGAFNSKKPVTFCLKTNSGVEYNLLVNFFKNETGNLNAVLSFNLKTEEDIYYKESILKNDVDAICIFETKQKNVSAFNRKFLEAFEIDFPEKTAPFVERKYCTDKKLLSIFEALNKRIITIIKEENKLFEFRTSKNNLATTHIECYKIGKTRKLIKLRNVVVEKNKFSIGESYLHFNFKYNSNGVVIYNPKNGYLVYSNNIFKKIADLNEDKNYSIYNLISVQHLKAFRNLETQLIKKKKLQVSKIISIKKNDVDLHYTKVNLKTIKVDTKKNYILVTFVYIDDIFKETIQKECKLQMYEHIFKKSDEGVAIYNLNEHTFSTANNTFYKLFKKVPAKVKGYKINGLLAVDDVNKDFDFFETSNSSKKVKRTLKYKRSNNSTFFGETKLYTLNSKNNRFLIINIKSVTKQLALKAKLDAHKKQLDELNKKYKPILNNGPVGIATYDFDSSRFIDVNRKWLSILKYKKQQALNKSINDLLFETQDDGTTIAAMHKKIKNEFDETGVFKGTLKLCLKNKTSKYVDVSILKFEDTKNRAFVFLTDHHQLTVEINHTAIQNKLLTNELNKFQFIFNISPNACGIIDMNTFQFIKANSKLLEIFGLKQKELSKVSAKDFFDEVSNNISVNDFLDDFFNELVKGNVIYREFFVLKQGKIPMLIRTLSTLLPKPNENSCYFTFQDINNEHQLLLENQRNLNTIYETENRFKTLFNSAQDGFVLIDVMQQEIIDCNPKVCEMFGYSKTNFLKVPLSVLLPKKYNDQNSITSYLKDVLSEIKEYRFYKSIDIFTNNEAESFYAEITIVRLNKLNSNLLFVQFTDKTVEKNIQKKLFKVESIFSSIIKHSRNGIAIIDMQTLKIFDVNERFIELFEEKKSIIAKNKAYQFSKLFPKGEKSNTYKKAYKLYKQIEKNKYDNFELECLGLKQRTKKTFYIRLSVFKLKSPLQNLLVISITDINDIKNAELAVAEKNKKIELTNKQLLINEDRFRLTLENANNFIARTKLNGQIIEHNHVSQLSLLNDINSKPPKFMYDFEWFKHFKSSVSEIRKAYKALKRNKKVQIQVNYKISVNIEGILELIFTKIYKNKKVDWVLVEGNDITEITSFQNQVSLNEQKFRAIYNNSGSFIGVFEKNGIIKELNKTIYDQLEDKNTIVTDIYLWDFPWFLKHKSTRLAFKNGIKKAANGEVATGLTLYDLPSAPNRYMQYFITPIFNKEKQIVFILGEGKDVTEAIKLNEAKALQQTKFTTFLKASKNAIIILDKSGTLEETNEKGKKLLSLAQSGFQNPSNLASYSNCRDYLKTQSQLKKHINNALKGKIESGSITHQNLTNDKVELEYYISPIFSNENKVIKLLLEFTDVTNKINDQLKLAESEKKFKAIFYSSLNFIIRLSPNGIVLEHNRFGHKNIAFAHIKKIIGKPIWTDKFLDKSRKGASQIKNDVKLCAKGEIVSNEIDYFIKSKDNPVKLKYTLKPIFDTNKNLTWLLLEGTNISDLKKAQNQLSKSLSKSEYFFENSLVASAIVNSNLQVVKTNKAFLKITGYTAEEVNKIGYFNLIYKKDIEQAKKNYKNIYTKKFTNATYKRRFISKSKQLKTAIFSFKSFYENGKFNGGYVTLSDITELEIKKQQLDDNVKKYKSLFDNNVAGLAICDKDGKLLKVNKALCDILGYKEKELLQMNNRQLAYKAEKNPVYTSYKDLVQAKIKKFTSTVKFIKKDGTLVDTIINISGVFNKENEFLYDVASISDISEIKKLEDQLANKVEELEKYIESNLELENFAFLASHDLRGPLVTVLSFTKILKSTLKNKISEKEYEYLGHIKAGVNRLQQSINDLLDFSSVSNNQLKIKSIDTVAWVNRILKDFEALIESNKAKIIIKKLPQTINIDESLYTRLIYNLISNSLKFVEKNRLPKIEIGCASSKNYHKFYFKDNGIGIPQKMQEKVFGIFKRLHPSEVYEGTGIGLALCKKVVERHNGKIWIKSEYKKGTTFYFSLPIN